MKKITLVIISFLMSQGLLGSEEYLDNLPVINQNELDEINLDKLVDEEKAKLHGQNNTNCGMSLEELAALVDTENPPNTSSCEPESNSGFDDLTKALEDNLISIPEEKVALTEEELKNLMDFSGCSEPQDQPYVDHTSPNKPTESDNVVCASNGSKEMSAEEEDEDYSDAPVSSSKQKSYLDASEANKAKYQSKSSSKTQESNSKKPYQCSHCEKCFTTKGHLITHERIHTGEKPYSCQRCGKSFAQSNNLTTHERTHTGEKPYSCKHCRKCFTRESTLKNHERIHTGEKPYQCKQCDQCFPTTDYLRTHESTHTGEKLHTCPYHDCGKSFVRPTDLTRHERTHTGERPYQCKQCDKWFKTSGNLRKHERTHQPQ